MWNTILIKTHHLKKWDKVKIDWKEIEFIKMDWAYAQWLQEDWTVWIGNFHFLEFKEGYYIPYIVDNENRNN